MTRADRWDRYDEADVRVRPPRRTRPRSKDRPAHEDAVPGLVVGVDRGRYTVVLAPPDAAPGPVRPEATAPRITAMTARVLGRGAVVVGDTVALVGDTSGAEGSLARIVRVEERSHVLRRSADDGGPGESGPERTVVVGADQMAIVTSVTNPEPRPRLIDRCLVAAYDAGIEPLLVITKTDLADPGDLLAGYTALQVPHVALSDRASHSVGHDALRARLAGRFTVLVGHSGVGKSTLVNALVPDADRSTGAVNDVTGRGRHTSTNALALPLPGEGGGWIVDTPGVRSFGLAHVEVETIVASFPDLAEAAEQCPRRCSHDEADCTLDAFVQEGRAGVGGPARLESLRRLLRARAGTGAPD